MEGDPGVPLLNFEGGPGFRVLGSHDPRSWGPGPTFTPCPNTSNCQKNDVFFNNSYQIRRKLPTIVKIVQWIISSCKICNIAKNNKGLSAQWDIRQSRAYMKCNKLRGRLHISEVKLTPAWISFMLHACFTSLHFG